MYISTVRLVEYENFQKFSFVFGLGYLILHTHLSVEVLVDFDTSVKSGIPFFIGY